MKLKKFDDYLKKRLNKEEIADIEHQSSLEAESLLALQDDVSKAVADVAKENKDSE